MLPRLATVIFQTLFHLYSYGRTDHQHSQNVSFHKIGITDVEDSVRKKDFWTLKTLETIRKELGHTKVSSVNTVPY